MWQQALDKYVSFLLVSSSMLSVSFIMSEKIPWIDSRALFLP